MIARRYLPGFSIFFGSIEVTGGNRRGIAVVGDFTKGTPDIGVFRSGQWIVDNKMDGTGGNRFNYGLPTDIPIVGKWVSSFFCIPVSITIYTIEGTAKILKIIARTVRAWLGGGKLKSFRLADLVLIHEDDLQDFKGPSAAG
jgi:hypothetical protein